VSDHRAVGGPPDLRRAFFAYGLFKHDELAFDQISQFVTTHEPAALPSAAMRVRDGLPLLDPSIRGDGVRGDVLTFNDPQEAYRVIGEFEPRDLYRWGRPVSVVARSGNVTVNVLVGRSPSARQRTARSVGLEFSAGSCPRVGCTDGPAPRARICSRSIPSDLPGCYG
jgi:hypothetical protein